MTETESPSLDTSNTVLEEMLIMRDLSITGNTREDIRALLKYEEQLSQYFREQGGNELINGCTYFTQPNGGFGTYVEVDGKITMGNLTFTPAMLQEILPHLVRFANAC